MSKSLMAKWTAWAANIRLHNDDKAFTANDPEYVMAMAAFYAGYHLRDDEVTVDPTALQDREAVPGADVMADAIVSALLRAHPAVVEWGVQVGTWPPTQYQDRPTAEYRAAHPFINEQEYPHTLVTRTSYKTSWVEAQS